VTEFRVPARRSPACYFATRRPGSASGARPGEGASAANPSYTHFEVPARGINSNKRVIERPTERAAPLAGVAPQITMREDGANSPPSTHRKYGDRHIGVELYQLLPPSTRLTVKRMARIFWAIRVRWSSATRAPRFMVLRAPRQVGTGSCLSPPPPLAGRWAEMRAPEREWACPQPGGPASTSAN